MKALDLRNLLLHAPRTEENYRKLPAEAGGVWWSRPSRNEFSVGRNWMYLRLALFIIGSVYFLYFRRDIGEVSSLLLIIGLYELAYYSNWKEKAKFESMFAEERYRASVDELLVRLYPGYQPGRAEPG